MASSVTSGIALVATAAVTLAGTVPAAAAPAAGRPGGQSIGDPYYPHDGNTGYEADHYGLRLTYQPGADHLSGTATIRATATQNLSRFSLDFYLTASSVRIDNTKAKFSQHNGKLTITPAADLPEHHHFTVVVRYQGVPSKVRIDGEKVWNKTTTGAFSTAEPHIASAWFPCNDHPLDKATYDVSVAVPKGTQALATGVLKSTVTRRGWTTWNWHGAQPQATYLQALTIGHYTIERKKAPDGRPVTIAYDTTLDAAHRKIATQDVEQTSKILAWESGIFGPYPFTGEGGVVVNDNGSDDAEEFQSLPVYLSGNFVKGDPHVDNIYVVAHENAHQWFGDSVSVRGWNDIWLNEGFANYTEWLWSAHTHQGTTQQLADQYYTAKKANAPYWQIKPGDPGVADQLADPIYTRGAMTLQALRNVVGDRAFFTILRDWAAQHRYGNGDTRQFIALADKVSGRSLDHFFAVWLFTKGRPAATPANGFPHGPPSAAPAPPSLAKIKTQNP